MMSRSEVDRANDYSIGPLLENQQIYLCAWYTLWWDKKGVLAYQSFVECTAIPKLELTDFRTIQNNTIFGVKIIS